MEPTYHYFHRIHASFSTKYIICWNVHMYILKFWTLVVVLDIPRQKLLYCLSFNGTISFSYLGFQLLERFTYPDWLHVEHHSNHSMHIRIRFDSDNELYQVDIGNPTQRCMKICIYPIMYAGINIRVYGYKASQLQASTRPKVRRKCGLEEKTVRES